MLKDHAPIVSLLQNGNVIVDGDINIEEEYESKFHAPSLRDLAANLYYASFGKLLMSMGIHPTVPSMIVKFGPRRGGFIRKWECTPSAKGGPTSLIA